MFELVQRGTITSLLQWVMQQSKLKGEFIALIAGVAKEK
jgi:16S rRNA C1402 (ribose-2'-O) methylase RsmI